MSAAEVCGKEEEGFEVTTAVVYVRSNSVRMKTLKVSREMQFVVSSILGIGPVDVSVKN